MYRNIERTKPFAGDYVGYAKSGGPESIYIIRKNGRKWVASRQLGSSSFTRATLRDVSIALEAC
jgi:hypothetical protein